MPNDIIKLNNQCASGSRSEVATMKLNRIFNTIIAVLLTAIVIFVVAIFINVHNSGPDHSVSSSASTTRTSSQKSISRTSEESTSSEDVNDEETADSYATDGNDDQDSSVAASTQSGDAVAPGYVPGEGTKFAYNIARAGGLVGADTLENEEEFYRNYQQNGNQITYNGRTVEYHRVDRPDGTYYYAVQSVD